MSKQAVARQSGRLSSTAVTRTDEWWYCFVARVWGPMLSLLIPLLTVLPARDLFGQTEIPSGERSALTAEQLEFFEKRIRPVLVEHCDDCHSATADPLQGGLILDSRQGLLNGGDSGPAIVPGQPGESLLIESLRYESFEMPPDGQLPARVIDDFETWIAMGAPDPRVSNGSKPPQPEIDFQVGRQHWAYQPIQRPSLPIVKDANWSRQPIDRFIHASLSKHDLQPGPMADRATLLRRLSFDLTGLPPTAEQIQRFLNDSRPDAYERLVDELLDSPHFGEHWGRHWLDLVRYAESITLRGFLLPEAWRYRDYVIQSFNHDRPYDHFLMQQIAGDLLQSESISQHRENLIATTFLTLGNTNLEQQDKQQLEMDYVDEQLDVIGKALMAQTITCARCHDHKFDPIPTRDYYALAGILANVDALKHDNVSQWIETPLPLDPEVDAEWLSRKQQRTEVARLVKQLENEIKQLESQVVTGGATIIDHQQARLSGPWQTSTHTKPFVGTGYAHDANENKGELTAVFELPIQQEGEYEVFYSYTPGGNRATNFKVVIGHKNGTQTLTVNQRSKPPILNQYVALGKFPFSADTAASVSVSNADTNGHVIIDGVMIRPVTPSIHDTERDELECRFQARKTQLEQAKQELKRIDDRLKQLPKVMTVRESKQIQDIPIHIRGNVHRLGDVVPRGVLQVVDMGKNLEMPADQSGRLELAAWITSPQNPLTSRVYANRVWHWLFGQGLVSTVDNFGTTGKRPTHPELLDFLASRLVESNWSTKALVREMVLSRTYRLATTQTAEARKQDPGNQWLSHMRRKRIPAESLRDSMLMASGELDESMGGRTFADGLNNDYGYDYEGFRRGVYVPVFRNSLPELYQVFDFPNPSLVVGKRTNSTSAPQALWMLNHPFVIARAQKTAARILKTQDGLEQPIELAYRTCLGRSPTPEEQTVAETFLRQEQSMTTPQEAWERLIQILFVSAEFRYIE